MSNKIDIKRKYFHQFDDDVCYTYDELIQYMQNANINEMKVYLAVKHRSEHFYCKYYNVTALKANNICGLICNNYTPRNGKNGICKHHSAVYVKSNECYTVTL